MRTDNVMTLENTLEILNQGYYILENKRIPLKLSLSQMREISVYLPEDVQEIIEKKDFPHVHVMGRVGVGCENMDSFSLARKRKEDTAFLLPKENSSPNSHCRYENPKQFLFHFLLSLKYLSMSTESPTAKVVPVVAGELL